MIQKINNLELLSLQVMGSRSRMVMTPVNHILVFLFQLAVTVHYENDLYRVLEQAGFVTLALVLERDAAIPVTVSVNTLDLLNSSVGDAATGEL